MNVGIYDIKTDDAVVIPFDAAVQFLGCSDYALKKAIKGEGVIPGKIITKADKATPLRWPKSRK